MKQTAIHMGYVMLLVVAFVAGLVGTVAASRMITPAPAPAPALGEHDVLQTPAHAPTQPSRPSHAPTTEC